MSELRILTPGLGAVSSTLMAGVMLARRGLGRPIGALTEYGELDGQPINDLVVALDDISFGAWDPFNETAYDVAKRSGVLTPEHLAAVADDLREISPKSAVFDETWVQALAGAPNTKTGDSYMDLVEQITDDIESYRRDGERLVMVWCGSTEAYHHPTPVHQSLTEFELGLKNSDSAIAPSQIYAYAAIRAGVPFANGAPNVTVDVPALEQMAEQYGVPIAGKDFKTGQTLLKTVIAPGLKSRRLGIRGWFSTNILGNRDGLVLDHPDNFRSKEITKLGVLDALLEPAKNPDLYGDLSHEVRINYYPPAGDNKEGWDNIDLVGWLDYPMQIKVNFLCRDSILAAPIVLDLARFLDMAKTAGNKGVQNWLGYYFKSPHPVEGEPTEHDLFVQERILLDEIRRMSAGLTTT